MQGPRGSIEIAKCANFRTNCATLNVTNSRGNPANLRGSRVEFREMGNLLPIFLFFLFIVLLIFQVLNISIYSACTVEE